MIFPSLWKKNMFDGSIMFQPWKIERKCCLRRWGWRARSARQLREGKGCKTGSWPFFAGKNGILRWSYDFSGWFLWRMTLGLVALNLRPRIFVYCEDSPTMTAVGKMHLDDFQGHQTRKSSVDFWWLTVGSYHVSAIWVCLKIVYP